ncbi:MAG: succinylglutamate desuccinylase [Firmicutes bacterium HGW-Firmicutes-7]|nr:MAG: succinylglutamate desuccinylase [Firmicutes bacterium HGW-Firmicutes-7]
MIENIVSIDLFVDEKLEIKRNRLAPPQLNGDEKRICIVTGIHGDELEGQYVCYQVIKKLKANLDKLTGIVDVYPALNPLGIDSISRNIPMFEMDMNRIFPGTENGAVAENIAAKILKNIEGATMCIDIHSSTIYLKEAPQVRMSEAASEKLLPFSQLLNMDYVWINPKEQIHHATLAHSLNEIGVPTMIVEMGVGMRITTHYGDILVEGLFRLMKELGIWQGDISSGTTSRIIKDSDIQLVSASCSGIFIPRIDHAVNVKKDTPLGDILDTLNGEILETVCSPCDGLILTLREYPVVYTGSLLVRLLGGIQYE